MNVRFLPQDRAIDVPAGTLLSDAAQQAGLKLQLPCGGQGRCGRCTVIVEAGRVDRRSTHHLAPEDVAAGYALACQTTVEGNCMIRVLPQQAIERRLTTGKRAVAIELPTETPSDDRPLRVLRLSLEPPSLADQTDDWARLRRALAQEYVIEKGIDASLPTLRTLGPALRQGDWHVTAALDQTGETVRLINVWPTEEPSGLYGAAIDIGTTSNHVWLIDLKTNRVISQQADYNGQIARGEDVISRIIYASKGNGLVELQRLVMETLNRLLRQAAREAEIELEQIYRATVAGNTTMLHLFAGIPPESIRLMPFVPATNRWPSFAAGEIGLAIHPAGQVDCLPGIGSYVGADITAGVVSSGMDQTDELTLFIDIGTNGEMVLGDGSWFIACACSAGPAFEGGGVTDGMRATAGAIEAIWISPETYEARFEVIGEKTDVRPRGICGSGLIALLGELFAAGVIDKSGNIDLSLPTERVRQGERGPEYTIAWADETAHDREIVITQVDLENLMRAKAAIYAGFAVLAQSVGVELSAISRVLIGGAFGQYLNVEQAVRIGMLPDLPYDRFHFLGNTSVRGAALALVSRDLRQRVTDVGEMMTYLELSADNAFFDAFNAAMFLPHTDESRFPSVEVGQ